MSETVFVVIRSDGEYSDRYETVLGYFSDESAAQAFCEGADREWKAAAASYPEPRYPSGMALLRDDYDLVWPQREIGKQSGEFGTVTFVTPDYSVEPQKVPVPEGEKQRRISVRADYRQKLEECRASRLAAVTLDKGGRPDSTWYYESAVPLPEPPAA